MWYLQVFEKDGDRLIKSYPLNGVGIGRIRTLFPGRSDAELVGLSWAVELNQASAVGQLVGEPLRFDEFAYFIDFFSEDVIDRSAHRSTPLGVSAPGSSKQQLTSHDRELVRSHLRRLGVAGQVRISTQARSDELVIVLPALAFASLTDHGVEQELQSALHRKVWITTDGPEWDGQTEELD
jgi:hypothetical protein